eukprot:scaffold903_cov262-Pinguiococcus_pyrenoidosus.AAC.24
MPSYRKSCFTPGVRITSPTRRAPTRSPLTRSRLHSIAQRCSSKRRGESAKQDDKEGNTNIQQNATQHTTHNKKTHNNTQQHTEHQKPKETFSAGSHLVITCCMVCEVQSRWRALPFHHVRSDVPEVALVFYQENRHPLLHRRISLRAGPDLHEDVALLAERGANGIQSRCDVIAASLELNGPRRSALEGRDSEQSLEDARVYLRADPEVHFYAILQQIDALSLQPLSRQVHQAWQTNLVDSGGHVGVLCRGRVADGQARFRWHVVDAEHPRVGVPSTHVDLHVRHEIQVEDPLVGGDGVAAAEGNALLQRHCVQGQQLERVRDLRLRRRRRS